MYVKNTDTENLYSYQHVIRLYVDGDGSLLWSNILKSSPSTKTQTQPDWYYMRDNHTFRKLSGDKDEVVQSILEEFYGGYSHGSVFSKSVGYENIKIHAQGKMQIGKFIDEVLGVMFP
jgi:ribosomal protein S19E (S16A)